MEERSVGECLGRVTEDLERVAGELCRLVSEGREAGPSGSSVGGPTSAVGSERVEELVRLLLGKEEELAGTLARLPAHRERQEEIRALEAELAGRNEAIGGLQSLLKDAESALITDIFQANQKLKSIGEAAARPVVPDELIRFAHRISKDNAVAAPLSWQQGDPSRPFPTDLQLRKGFLMPRKPEAPAPPPLPTGPPHRMPFHPFPRQGSPGAMPPGGMPPHGPSPRLPPASPYQGGPMGLQRMPPSPLSQPGGQRALPPYPGSPRGWSPGAVPRGPPAFPHQGSPGLSPRTVHPAVHPRFPTHFGGLPNMYQGGPREAGPRPSPAFPPMPVHTPNPYQAGPVGAPAVPRPQAPHMGGPVQRPPPPPLAQPPPAQPPKTEAKAKADSSPESSSTSSSGSPNN